MSARKTGTLPDGRMAYRTRTCARCGVDVSGSGTRHGHACVRLQTGVRESVGLFSATLCPACACDLAADMADRLGVVA